MAGSDRLSAHFTRAELWCPESKHLHLYPGLLEALERLRELIRRPLPIISGYRSPSYNRKVGGARASRHLAGAAVDIPLGLATVGQAVAAGFVGIGTEHDAGGRLWVRHADLRPGGPARWHYGDPH